MARAKRQFLLGHAWHLTHRCHKKEFLLKLVKDRQRYLYWLFEAKQALEKSKVFRESKWTQSIAVGDRSYLEQIKDRLGIRAKGRKIQGREGENQLRVTQSYYGGWHDLDNENSFHWNLAS